MIELSLLAVLNLFIIPPPPPNPFHVFYFVVDILSDPFFDTDSKLKIFFFHCVLHGI